MKTIKKEDLKNGDIYVEGNIMTFINKQGTDYSINYSNSRVPHFYKNGDFTYFNAREATPEEKHWLETCIKEDKFISYEEAMKTFVPEYVECVRLDHPTSNHKYFGEIGKVYKVINYNHTISDMKILETEFSVNKNRFKPSTKEAYDAQFAVKKPEIVLEEPKDTILVTKDGKYIGVQSSEGGIYQLGDKIQIFGGSKNPAFKNKKYFTIIGFRWSKDKSKICAVFNAKFPNGIGLDKIELYVEPVQELSLLEQAKLRYPVGTKFKNAFLDKGDSYKTFEITNFDNFYEATKVSHNTIGIYYNDEWLYYNNQWAEIVDDFVLPEKWCIKVTPENNKFINSIRDRTCRSFTFITSKLIFNSVKNSWLCNSEALTKGFTEITLEQFKKYVLNEKI